MSSISWEDFGDELGIKESSAQITTNYQKDELIANKSWQWLISRQNRLDQLCRNAWSQDFTKKMEA